MMNRLLERLPGLVIVAGQLGVILGSDRFENPVAIAALMAVAVSSLLLRNRDALGLAAAVLLASAAAVSSIVIAVLGCAAAVVGLVLSSVLQPSEGRGLGAWVALAAVCAALAFGSAIELPTSAPEEEAAPIVLEVLPPPVSDVVDPDPSPAFEAEWVPDVRPSQATGSSERTERASEIEAVLVAQAGASYNDLSVRAPLTTLPSGIIFGDRVDQQDRSAAWMLALLFFVAGVLLIGWTRRIRALGDPVGVAVLADDHWGRLQRIAKQSGVVRRPSESVLDFVKRYAAKTDDNSAIGIGELISSELYGEPSQRRSDIINRWLDQRDDG